MTNRRNFLKSVGALGVTSIVGIPAAAVEVASVVSAPGLAATAATAAAAAVLPWNWKDLVQFQPSLAKTGNVHCLMVREPEEDQPPSQIKIQIVKEPVECTLTEEELVHKLREIFMSMPAFEVSEVSSEIEKEIQNNRIKNQIHIASRRGSDTVEWEGVHIYKGTSATDGPVIVSEFEGLYGIALNPNWQNYGRKVVLKENNNVIELAKNEQN